MNVDGLNIFIGYDETEHDAYRVCVRSLVQLSTVPLRIWALDQRQLRAQGLYWRTSHLSETDRPYPEHAVPRGATYYDDADGKPFSTEFSFTRFLVPHLMRYTFGTPALYCDCDFLWRADVKDLFDLFDPRYAVQVVKHEHVPPEDTKMAGLPQVKYDRKNWSSLVLWDVGHPAHAKLTVSDVNGRPGSYLHGFRWLDHKEIGELPEAWNWLEGHSSPKIKPKAVHFTRGGPWIPGQSDPYPSEMSYVDEWLAEWRRR